MKIIISQHVLLKDKINTFRRMHKEYESEIIPHKGDFIYDTAFKDPYEYEVVSVIIDYKENTCNVTLENIELETTRDDAVKEFIELAVQHHGWKCNTL